MGKSLLFLSFAVTYVEDMEAQRGLETWQSANRKQGGLRVQASWCRPSAHPQA